MSDPIVLAPKLDLAAASALMTTLKQHDEGEVILDLSEVKHFGALCMQTIMCAANEAAAQGRSLAFINASDRVVDQMRVMGMTPETITGGIQ